MDRRGSWQELDKRFRYRNEKLVTANRIGYSTISEAIVSEYARTRSARVVGDIFGMTSNGIRFAVKAFGLKTNGHGGYRPGDIRRGRPKKY